MILIESWGVNKPATVCKALSVFRIFSKKMYQDGLLNRTRLKR